MIKFRLPSCHRLRLALAPVALLLALFLACAPTPASASVKTFRPVKKAPRAITFKPKGINPRRVHSATVRLRSGERVLHHRLNLTRVRRALRNRHQIRLRKSLGARPGRLVISFAASRPSSASTSCTFGTFSAANPPGACWRPYGETSPFNTPVGASPAVASDSSQVVANWLSTWSATNKASEPRFVAGEADSSEDYDHPIYYSQASDPVYTVHCTESWGRCPIEGMQVHIPAAARPAGGSDGHLAVIEQSSGWEYDFWQVHQKPEGGGTLTASWGGRTMINGNGLGSAADAAGFGLAAGVIRPEELAAGHINHALFMVVKCTNGTSVWPAGSNSGRSCSSMGLSNTNAPAMGQHFYLDLSEAQIEALNQPAWSKTILRAMAQYGLYVGDTGGGFLKLESGTSFTSFGQAEPWSQIAKSDGISPSNDPSTGKETYTFDFSGAVNWAADLKVAAG